MKVNKSSLGRKEAKNMRIELSFSLKGFIQLSINFSKDFDINLRTLLFEEHEKTHSW